MMKSKSKSDQLPGQSIVNNAEIQNQYNINYANKVLIFNREYFVPFLSPPLATDLKGRSELLNQIIFLLRNKKHPALGLAGIPGIGKTSIAVAITHNSDVQQLFDDGILWWGLGKNGDLSIAINSWLTAMGVSEIEISKNLSLDERKIMLRNFIGLKNIMLVIDDVWNTEQAASLMSVRGPNCIVILTSRQKAITDTLCSTTLTIQPLKEKDSQSLFYSIASNVADYDKEGIQTILSQLGGLPLAITLLARKLRRVGHAGQTRRIRDAVQKLADYKNLLTEPYNNLEPDYYPSLSNVPISLWAAIKLSDDELTANAKKMFYSMSLFAANPSSFSSNALLTITKMKDESIDEIIDVGLVDLQQSERIIMHQVIHDYAKLFYDDTYTTDFISYYVQYTKENSANLDEIDLEIENITAALNILKESNDKKNLVELSNSIYLYMEARGAYTTILNYLPAISESADFINQKHFLQALLYRGRALGSLGQYAEAEECYQFVREKANDTQEFSELKCDAYKGLGTVYERYGKYEDAIRYIQKGLSIANREGYISQEISLTASLGYILGLTGKNSEARKILKGALAQAKKIKDLSAESGLAINLGSLTNGKLGSNYLKRALRLARKINHRERACVALYNLGWADSMQGNFEAAIQYLKEGADISRAIGQKERLNLCLKQLAFVQSYKNQHQAALKNIDEALSICQELNHPRLLASCQLFQSIILTNSGQLDVAHNVINLSITTMQKINSPYFVSWGLVQRGEIYLLKESVSQAINDFNNGLEIARKINVEMQIGLSLYGLSKAYYRIGDLENAIKSGSESLILLKKLGHFSADEVKNHLEALKAKNAG